MWVFDLEISNPEWKKRLWGYEFRKRNTGVVSLLFSKPIEKGDFSWVEVTGGTP